VCPASLPIKIDFRSDAPIYLQIVDQVRQLVASGRLRPGDQLPTVRQMATDLRVNFNTVARAYRLLDEARLISTQQGRGTYIWDEPPPEALNAPQRAGLPELARQFAVEAARLGCTPEEIRQAVDSALKAPNNWNP